MLGLGLSIVSGGAVRLTGSGLGCPDWPNCQQYSFAAPLRGHQGIEFGNRLLTVLVTVIVLATVVAAFRVLPKRADLIKPALGLVAGIVAQIVIGGLVVIYHLWPPLVMLHFLLSESLVALGVVLYNRARYEPGAPVAMVGPRFVMLSRLLVGATATLIAIGTSVSGAGPNSGDTSSGEIAKRLPITFRSITELHSTVAALLVGLVIATLFATWIANAPQSVTKAAMALLGALVIQAIIGYAQYFLKVPAGLVIAHLAGATIVWLAVIWFHLGLFARSTGELSFVNEQLAKARQNIPSD